MDLLKTSFAVALALMPLAVSIMIKMDFLYAFVGLVITMVISYNILRHWFDQYMIPSIAGKFVLITGCDTGFGRELGKKPDIFCIVFMRCGSETLFCLIDVHNG